MIGVYDYTVIATYLSLILGLGGIYASMQGAMLSAILCLMLSGFLDAFDGRIARTKKNRTDTEKRFGIQIDSLNDLVCFGVLPAAIGVGLGGESRWFLTTMAFYVICALIRLAYFNVLEEERQSATSEGRRFYLGMPVTSAAFMAPLFWLLPLYTTLPVLTVYSLGLFLLGVLFITPIHVRKPKLSGIIALSMLGLAEITAIIFVAMGL